MATLSTVAGAVNQTNSGTCLENEFKPTNFVQAKEKCDFDKLFTIFMTWTSMQPRIKPHSSPI